MIPHGLGNLYSQLKDMENDLADIEKRIATAAYNNYTNSDFFDPLVKDYRKKREEYNIWMRKTVYEKED